MAHDIEISEDQFLYDIFKDGFEIAIDANDFKKVLRQNVELSRIMKQQQQTIENQKKANEFLRDQLKELREPRVIVRLNERA